MNKFPRAFTLVEIMISASIAITVMTVVWGFFSGFLRISNKGSNTVSALTEMSIAFSWLRRDLSTLIIHEPVVDENGKLHEVSIIRNVLDNGATQDLNFYSVIDVIKENAKPVSGIIKYTLINSENGLYSLNRSLHNLDGETLRSKTFLKGKIRKFTIEFYRHSESLGTTLINGSVLSMIQGNLPDSMKVIIEQDDSSRINAAIAINSPYIGENNHDNYYANWLLQNVPYSGSSPEHIPRYIKKKTVNVKGYGIAIASWEEDVEQDDVDSD